MKSDVSINGNRLQITRVFDAPRHLVFGWWSKAEKLQQWSGCKDATRCEVEMDFRVGGSFTQKMQLGDKGEFSIAGKYEEIVEPARIVYSANLSPVVTRITVEFFEEGKGTKMVLTHDGLRDEFLCKTIGQGTTESLDKLEGLLASVRAATANEL
jgi:uncharacterized protein YndB with AHSA1/START domain